MQTPATILIPKRLPLLVAAAALPVLIFAIAMIVLFSREQQKPVEQMLRSAAQSAMAAIDQKLVDSIATLEALAASPHVDTADWPAFYEHARRVLYQQPDWITMRLSDARTRQQILNLMSPAGAALPEALDPAAIDRVVATMQPLVGPLRRPQDGATEPFVVVRVPVLQGGEVRYTLSASLRADAVSRVLREHGAPEGWTLGVLDQTKHIVGRNQRDDAFIGTHATPTLADAIDADEGFFFALNKEGEEVYTAIHQSPFSGWTVAVGAPEGQVKAALHRSLLAVIGGGIAAFGLAFLLVVSVGRALAARQQAERRLTAMKSEQMAEQRLSEIAKNFPGLIYRRVMHSDGTVSYPYVSRSAEASLGLPPAEARRRTSVDEIAQRCFHPEDAVRWREAIITSARTLEPYSIEVRVLGADGRLRWLQTTASVHRGDGGTIVWDAIVLDISQRKEAGEALRRSEAELHRAQTIAKLGHWTWRPDDSPGLSGGFSEYSPAAAAIYGVEPAALAVSNGEYLRRFVHPDDRDALRTTFVNFGRSDADSYEREYRILRADGAVRWVHERGERVRGGDGQLIYSTGTVQDITERKQAEERLREREEHLRLALRSAEAGAWVWEIIEDRFIWSDETYGVYGLDPAVQPSPAVRRALIHPDDRDRVDNVIRNTLAEKRRDYECEFRINHSEKGVRWLMAIGQVTYSEGGRPVRMSGITMDVTDRKQTEEHQKVLMAELNHRVKNTLAVVQSIAAQTLRKSGSLDRFADSFKGRLQALASAHSLLTQGNWRSAKLRQLIDSAIRAHGAGKRDVLINGPNLALSPKQALALSLVFHELATNAAKYGALSVPTGRIEIHWGIDGEGARRQLRLEWVERGGPYVDPPTSTGFGTTLIRRSIEYDLHGAATLAYDPEGLRCLILFPLKIETPALAPAE